MSFFIKSLAFLDICTAIVVIIFQVSASIFESKNKDNALFQPNFKIITVPFFNV